MNEKDLEIRWTRGTGPGGTNRNKLENCCVLTHLPTGTTVTVDGRKRAQNLKRAKRLMRKRLQEARDAANAAKRKARRDEAIHDRTRVRTYDYSTGIVTDHRTGRKATIKDILVKGKLGKFYD